MDSMVLRIRQPVATAIELKLRATVLQTVGHPRISCTHTSPVAQRSVARSWWPLRVRNACIKFRSSRVTKRASLHRTTCLLAKMRSSGMLKSVAFVRLVARNEEVLAACISLRASENLGQVGNKCGQSECSERGVQWPRRDVGRWRSTQHGSSQCASSSRETMTAQVTVGINIVSAPKTRRGCFGVAGPGRRHYPTDKASSMTECKGTYRLRSKACLQWPIHCGRSERATHLESTAG